MNRDLAKHLQRGKCDRVGRTISARARARTHARARAHARQAGPPNLGRTLARAQARTPGRLPKLGPTGFGPGAPDFGAKRPIRRQKGPHGGRGAPGFARRVLGGPEAGSSARSRAPPPARWGGWVPPQPSMYEPRKPWKFRPSCETLDSRPIGAGIPARFVLPQLPPVVGVPGECRFKVPPLPLFIYIYIYIYIYGEPLGCPASVGEPRAGVRGPRLRDTAAPAACRARTRLHATQTHAPPAAP